MVKCPCGKKIVFKRWAEREVEEEPEEETGSYYSKPKNLYRGISSDVKMKKIRIYGCQDPICIYTSDMTEDEYLKIEEDQSDDF